MKIKTTKFKKNGIEFTIDSRYKDLKIIGKGTYGIVV
jgi:hypothetical protein